MSGTKLGVSAGKIKCHACAGWFSIGFQRGRGKAVRGEPVAFHSLPYCAAFDAIETTVDAVAFSEKCRAAGGAEKPS